MKIKKLLPNNNQSKKGLREFIEKRGFYVVLILCIAIVAVTVGVVTSNQWDSYSLNNNDKTPNQTDNSSIAAADNKITDQSFISTEQNNVNPKTTDGTSADTSKATVTPKPTAAKQVVTAKIQNFVMPVFGNITLEFAANKLIYSRTLEDWRTHSGVDIASTKGTQVKAVADGVVSQVTHDPGFGFTIIINHQNGLKTIYSNLAGNDTVYPNQKVKQGEAIGAVGNTAVFESEEQSHLHFEVLKNNINVNPMTYLPKY